MRERIRLLRAGKLDRPRGVKTVQNCSTREVRGFILHVSRTSVREQYIEQAVTPRPSKHRGYGNG